MRAHLRASLALVALFALGACEKANTGKTETIAPDPNDPVKVSSPGTGPTRTLRLSAKQGDKQSAVMTMKLTMNMMGTTIDAPPIEMTLDVATTGVSPEGDITQEMTISAVEVKESEGSNPMVAGAMRQQMGKIVGTKATSTVSNRGLIKKVDVQNPPDADPMVVQVVEGMKDSFTQLGAPLPAAPVGVGATWEMPQTVNSQGMKIDQLVTYKVTKIDGDVVTLDTVVKQNAGEQKISQGGIEVEVKKVTGGGTGTVVMDLTKALPASVKAKVETDAQMRAGGQDMNTNMKVDMTLAAK